MCDGRTEQLECFESSTERDLRRCGAKAEGSSSSENTSSSRELSGYQFTHKNIYGLRVPVKTDHFIHVVRYYYKVGYLKRVQGRKMMYQFQDKYNFERKLSLLAQQRKRRRKRRRRLKRAKNGNGNEDSTSSSSCDSTSASSSSHSSNDDSDVTKPSASVVT